MLVKSISGQFLYFGLNAAFSGTGVAGIASGNVSGRRAIDGGALIVCSGPVIEDGGGLYHVNLYNQDVAGNCIGFLFTASGCSPVTFTVTTTGNVSGNLYLNSGASMGVISGNLSGQLVGVLSGQLSGFQVGVSSGQLSGQLVNLLSGNQVQVWSGTNVNVFSGQLSGQLVGMFSGATVNVYSGQLSGQQVNLASGNQVQVWSGTQVNVFSGQLSGQPTSLLSGQLVNVNSGNLSGQLVNLLSGNQVQVWSGTQVNVFSGQLSGQLVGLLSGQNGVQSGQVFFASGIVQQATLMQDLSGIQNQMPVNSLGTAALKLVSKFNGQSGITTMTDGVTVKMRQTVTTASGLVPISQLGVGQ